MHELLKYTLIADGSSDKILMNIIKWSLDDLFLENLKYLTKIKGTFLGSLFFRIRRRKN